MVLPTACAPGPTGSGSVAGDPVARDTVSRESGGGGSLAGRLDAGSVMSDDDWSPGQSYSDGLAASSAESEAGVVTVAEADPQPSSPEPSSVEKDSIDLVLAPEDRTRTVLPLPLSRIDLALAALAEEADDPVTYEFVRSLLPMLAIDGVGADAPGFEPSVRDLLPEEVEMLEAVSEFATGLRAGLDSGVPHRPFLTERVSELLERLRNESGLKMGRVELCTSIAGYGDLEVASRRMPAGRDQEILVYAELDGLNWTDKPGGEVGWELRYRLELHQMSDGMVIDPGVESSVSDTLVAPVGDNYLWIRYRLPAGDLNAGRYVLKLRVREPSTNREDERSIEIDLLPERLLGRTVSVGGS